MADRTPQPERGGGDHLLPFLLVLALLDLGFVQATEVVSLRGLLPLWILTAAAPWLRRLQHRRLFRIGWNGTVLLVFAMLCRHAFTTGLLHMLEDGLLLAILCQVHLLHNVGARQRPDLVFFNSLLIAFVTSFFVTDLQWSLLFALHALALVAALQANLLLQPHAAQRNAIRWRWLWIGSARHTAVIGALTAIGFVCWPRDFHRQGWLETNALLPTHRTVELADRIELGDQRPATRSDELALRVIGGADRPPPPSHWRSAVFTLFDGITWHPPAPRGGDQIATGDPRWRQRPDGQWSSSTAATLGCWTVQQFASRQRGLLLPLGAAAVRSDTGGLQLDARPHGLLGTMAAADLPIPLLFTVRCLAQPQPTPLGREERNRCLQLPARLPEPVAAIVAAQAQHSDAPVRERVAQAAAWLRQERRYELPGQPGFARTFTDFLRGAGAGHCEYFAAALALVLRAQDIPCRMVGGFLLQEFDPSSGSWLARAKHAHAWVEFYGDDDCWHTIDATPAQRAAELLHEGPGLLTALRQRGEAAWQTVLGFDGSQREQWLAAIASLPWVVAHGLATLPGIAGALLLLAGLAWWSWRRRHPPTLPAIRALERAVAAAGLRLEPGETPRELAMRANTLGLTAAQRAHIAMAAAAHEATRYARGTGVPP